ncbi:MAG: molybdenum cofactor biosynthesis protein [Pelagibacteraceae bacterium TMED65]|nr:molybdenum cofactor biosynthesis protein [Rickettsiales bacterium]OUU51118.1 MAG: molybdenum cofactor biosynthesis protein [Pelagibacteraceae bacterium TMED65]|tara:strand:+ start:215 stop:736 length:522 start_codon:yes stop_codon:yes gene_type:complete
MNQNSSSFISLNISIVIVSDSRNESSDKSGKVLVSRILEAGHKLIEKKIIRDEPKDIKSFLTQSIRNGKCNVILLSGGTGLTGRDSTPEVVKRLLTKEIPGFGEIFRYISFKKIGTSSLQSRAIGGLAHSTFIFALPGSPGACKDAWDEILKFQLDSRTKPCNLVELIPRLKE